MFASLVIVRSTSPAQSSSYGDAYFSEGTKGWKEMERDSE